MESLRKRALQIELDRIQAHAEANSFAIMNKADQLAAAHELCLRINDGLDESMHFSPQVRYTPPQNGCDVLISTHDLGDVFLRRAKELGVQWESVEIPFDGTHRVRFGGVPSVDVFIRSVYLEMRDVLDEATA